MIKLTFKTLNVGDVEDPDVYLGAVIWDWFQSEHGQWVKSHAKKLTYQQYISPTSLGYQYSVNGILSNEDALFYKLKWPNQ
jgi:hypothetical protein